jgi:DNA-binding LacI/PurR family transcriptional regulator
VLLSGEASAVVCASDVLALAVVVAARARGLDVPGDVSVTGFDDSPLAALASPGLTSVRVDYGEFGEAAAGTLLAAIGVADAPDFQPSAPELVVRASTGAPRE